MESKSNTQKEVLEIIQNMPGIASHEVRELMPHVGYAPVMSMLSYLKKKGIIVETGEKKTITKGNGVRAAVACYAMNPDPDPKPLAPKFKRSKQRMPTPSALELRIEELSQKVQELETWKQHALARHPDLAVPPIILRARALVASELRAHNDPVLAQAVERGQKDETLMVRIAAKALEEVE